jgi:photosystem II stability/assembly factor-like uncharacterized protein
MKNHYLILLFFTSFFFGQTTWSETNISQSVSRYDDVFFLNENLGWAADGYGATVYKTQDGGNTWDLQFELPQNYFRNIEFLNENIGFLGTLNGGFFKTTDGGTTWNTVVLPGANSAICGLDAVGSSTIYGCGAYFGPAYIIKSTDSGATWSYINMSAYATGLVEVLFTSETVGYASGRSAQGGVILKTINGGSTWTNIYTTQHAGDYVWKLQILFSNTNVMFGSVSSVTPFLGQLIKSTNGGLNWTTKNVPDTNIQAVGFITENHGWMGGHGSGFLETFDSGTTWIDTGFGNSLNRIVFINSSTAYTCGDKIYKLSPNLSAPTFSNQEFKPLSIVINPNPIVDKLNIEIDFKATDNLLLELYTLEGKLIKQFIRDSNKTAIKKSYSFDFPFPKGTYILNFHTNSDRQSIKIIK